MQELPDFTHSFRILLPGTIRIAGSATVAGVGDWLITAVDATPVVGVPSFAHMRAVVKLNFNC